MWCLGRRWWHPAELHFELAARLRDELGDLKKVLRQINRHDLTGRAMVVSMHTVYEAAGGDSGLRRLAAAWHDRVMADEVVSHAFSHGYRTDHTERLAAYWAEALGGPNAYTESFGDESFVVRAHSGNGPHEEMDRRAVVCFDLAMADVGLTDEPLHGVLHSYFAWATTTTMSRYHASAADVPGGLSLPHWSWDGLQA